MAELTRRISRRSRTTPNASEPAAATDKENPISPQDFYREMAQREDVRRILVRLAQINDGRA